MYDYSIGLQCGGLMEDPDWHIEKVKDIEANNLKEAKDKWAEITGENKKGTWNSEYQTVWGWSLKLTYSNDPNVTKNDYFRS